MYSRVLPGSQSAKTHVARALVRNKPQAALANYKRHMSLGLLTQQTSSHASLKKTCYTSLLSAPKQSFHVYSPRMATNAFLLADIGEGITECEVIQWFVEPGSRVEEFDKICEVQSDKASVEITSRFSGVVTKVHYQVNDIARVGQPLVDIETDGEQEQPVHITEQQGVQQERPSEKSTKEWKRGSVAVEEQHSSSFKRLEPALATPAVRRIAKEHGVNIQQVQGRGEMGRVLEQDVIEFVKRTNEIPMSTPTLTPTPTPTPTPTHTPITTSTAGTDTTEPLSNMQKAMLKAMTHSLTIPHFGYNDDIEIDAAREYRAALNQHIASNANNYSFTKMSYLPIFIKCISIALGQFPLLNSTMTGDFNDVNSIRVVTKSSHNIGIAIDSPQGLIVPNIKDVQSKTILDVAAEVHRLTALGKTGSLGPADLKGGTITLSNIGTIGGTYANPVVFSSQVAIVALGRTQTLPRFDKTGQVVARQIMPVSWSADHRLIDGATMARFANKWKGLIENPVLLASELR
ncbi:putative biotin-dependent 2-oxo acid dehydrogenases acyltransferase [Spinellus fusiger]|nr:putative biotin-dependent 2-oxo acid dehydrogenases acyltransferase [Spinellus fusiger]